MEVSRDIFHDLQSLSYCYKDGVNRNQKSVIVRNSCHAESNIAEGNINQKFSIYRSSRHRIFTQIENLQLIWLGIPYAGKRLNNQP